MKKICKFIVGCLAFSLMSCAPDYGKELTDQEAKETIQKIQNAQLREDFKFPEAYQFETKMNLYTNVENDEYQKENIKIAVDFNKKIVYTDSFVEGKRNNETSKYNEKTWIYVEGNELIEAIDDNGKKTYTTVPFDSDFHEEIEESLRKFGFEDIWSTSMITQVQEIATTFNFDNAKGDDGFYFSKGDGNLTFATGLGAKSKIMGVETESTCDLHCTFNNYMFSDAGLKINIKTKANEKITTAKADIDMNITFNPEVNKPNLMTSPKTPL